LRRERAGRAYASRGSGHHQEATWGFAKKKEMGESERLATRGGEKEKKKRRKEIRTFIKFWTYKNWGLHGASKMAIAALTAPS